MLLLATAMFCARAALRSEDLDTSQAGAEAAWTPLLHKEAEGFQAVAAPAQGVPGVVRSTAPQMLNKDLRFFPGQGKLGKEAARVPSNVPQMFDVDMNVVIGGGALLLSVGGGVGLIAAVEGAGKRNEETVNQQSCVDCQGTKVVSCAVCKGTGQDQFASLVAGVQEMAGDAPPKEFTIMVDDWDSGPREIVPFADILANYPVKVKTDICITCDGRGVIVCDSCEGTGYQPRFLERYSPDDFMD